MNKFRNTDREKHYNQNFSCESESGVEFFDCEESKIEVFEDIWSEKQELTDLGELKSGYSDYPPGKKRNGGFSGKEVVPPQSD